MPVEPTVLDTNGEVFDRVTVLIVLSKIVPVVASDAVPLWTVAPCIDTTNHETVALLVLLFLSKVSCVLLVILPLT